MPEEFVTRPTLLIRVRDQDDQESWAEFVEIYGPLIHRFALSRGVHRDDAADVTQNVLKVLARVMADFQYDRDRGTFRGWLFTVVRREIIRIARKAKVRPESTAVGDGEAVIEQLPETKESQDWEHDYQKHLAQWAMGKIRSEFSDHVWEAFQATSVQGSDPAEVAKTLGMRVGTVYVAKSRVLKRLVEKVKSVDEAEWEADAVALEAVAQ